MSLITDLLLQVSAAIAGPAALGAFGYAYRTWKDVHERTDRNAEANWGSDDPHNPWPGTVRLSVDHEERLQQVEESLDIEPPEPQGRWQSRFAMADGGYPTFREYLKYRARRTRRRLREWWSR